MGGNLCVFTNRDCQLVERFADGLGHFASATSIHHTVAHAAHDIFTKTDLRVHDTSACDHFSARQIAKLRAHCCRSNVDGHPVQTVLFCWP